jgi:hypothetical protein
VSCNGREINKYSDFSLKQHTKKVSHLTDAPIRMHRYKFTLINLTSMWCMADYYKLVCDDKIMHDDKVVAEAHSANLS